MAAPNGTASPSPDYLVDETRGPAMIVTSVLMAVIATAFVALRLYTRICIVRKLCLADWTILFALIFSIGNSVGTILQVHIGSTGRHIWTLPPDVVGPWLKYTYFTDISYIISLVSIKLSILLLYLRILSALFLRRLCYTALVFISICSAYSLVTFIFMCFPVEAFWDPMNHPGAWCFPGALKYYVDVGIHLMGEIIILFLPMPYLISLQLPLRRKMGYIMLFALGIIVIVISFARLPSIIQFNTMTDPSWDAAPIAIWSAVEINIAIVCACGMTLRPLASRLFRSISSNGFHPHRENHGDPFWPDNHGPSTIGARRQKRTPNDPNFVAMDSVSSRLSESDPGQAVR